MSAFVAIRPALEYGIVHCPARYAFLPGHRSGEVCCTSCGVSYPVTY